jgi:hypothetical protein
MTQPVNVPSNLTLTITQYTALVALARVGAVMQNADQTALEQFLVSIEKANGVTRYLLWVRWQELDEPLPSNVSFPTTWPSNLSQMIQIINRPVALTDVQAVLTSKAKNPTNVMVTPDPNAALGWSTLNQFFNGEVD